MAIDPHRTGGTVEWTRWVMGAIAGIVATAPMTMAMRHLHRRLPPPHRYPLPPRELVESSALRRLGNRGNMTIIAHFLYGGAAGAIFAATWRRPRLRRGALYGVIVWTASYLGWIPSIGLLKPATRHPVPRNALMVGVHLVWGTCLAACLEEMDRSSAEAFSAGPARDADEGAD